MWGYGMLSGRPAWGNKTIGKSGERGSRISVLPARHDDDDDDWYTICCCIHEGSDKVFLFIISSMSFSYLQKSIKFVSNSYHIFIAYISIGKLEPVIMYGFDCFLFQCRLRYILARMILWSEDPIYLTPPLGQDMTQGQFLKRSLAGLNSEFSFP